MSSRVATARASPVDIQETLLDTNFWGELGSREKETTRKFNLLEMMEESLMHQKARVRLLGLEDRNRTFFFRTWKGRHNINDSLTREDGVVLSYSTELMAEVVRYFSSHFTSTHRQVPLDEELI